MARGDGGMGGRGLKYGEARPVGAYTVRRVAGLLEQRICENATRQTGGLGHAPGGRKGRGGLSRGSGCGNGYGGGQSCQATRGVTRLKASRASSGRPGKQHLPGEALESQQGPMRDVHHGNPEPIVRAAHGMRRRVTLLEERKTCRFYPDPAGLCGAGPRGLDRRRGALSPRAVRAGGGLAVVEQVANVWARRWTRAAVQARCGRVTLLRPSAQAALLTDARWCLNDPTLAAFGKALPWTPRRSAHAAGRWLAGRGALEGLPAAGRWKEPWGALVVTTWGQGFRPRLAVAVVA
ncbi:hypothetical protein WJX73_007801 [Symbiochloris irregularis]|uniref:Uncharacterized protein n=1 Tax=Symbiochloris irregularis TaxID=706552 RepID=A0AAW1NN49_9CHLO